MPTLTIAQVEAAVLGRLQERIDTVAVDAYPDRPETYQLKHASGAVLVRYAGSRFGEPEPTDVVAQTQTITIEAVTMVRNLHKLGDHAGLLDLLHAVRAALTGYRIPSASAIWPVQEAYEGYADGVWQYVTTFALGTLHTEPPVTRPKIEYTEGVGYADDISRFLA